MNIKTSPFVKNNLKRIFLLFFYVCFLSVNAQKVTTLAGNYWFFTKDIGNARPFDNPTNVAIDVSGNIFVVDSNNHRVRKITPHRVVSTLAGSGTQGYTDGTGNAAQFNYPAGVAIDASGNVFVADMGNNCIRIITATGVVTTLAGSGEEGFADGKGTTARFNGPSNIAVDTSGNVFVADVGNHCIRKITTDGVVTTLAGSTTQGFADGVGNAAQFNHPTGVAVDASGNVFVGDSGNHRIRKITAAGIVSTFAGSSSGFADGVGNGAQFNYPVGLAVDYSGNIFVADYSNHRIRKITATGVVTTLAERTTQHYADGTANSRSNYPRSVAIDASGNVFVADSANSLIWKITPAGVVSTFAGLWSAGFVDGAGSAARFAHPTDVAVDASGNVFVADHNNSRIRKITAAGVVSTLAGSGEGGFADGIGVEAQFNKPSGVAVDASGNVFVADCSNHRIRKITAAGVVSTLAGSGKNGFADGRGTTAQFDYPSDVAVDVSGNVFVADYYNDCIRKITAAGVVSTFAGSAMGGFADGVGNAAKFSQPTGVAVDAFGNVFVADYMNNRIRKITAAGVVTTLAGSGESGFANGRGTTAQFYGPHRMAVDAYGNVFVTDNEDNLIRKITAAGEVTTFAGSAQDFTDGTVTEVQFDGPEGLAIDASGNVFVADCSNSLIRKITVLTLTFMTNGGTSIADMRSYKGDAITPPSKPTRRGYKFAGWYTDNETFANVFSFATGIRTDTKVYAKWTAVVGSN